MKITRLTVENFKSFDTLDLELGDFNVFIGANASGKSNFLSILTFLLPKTRTCLRRCYRTERSRSSPCSSRSTLRIGPLSRLRSQRAPCTRS